LAALLLLPLVPPQAAAATAIATTIALSHAFLGFICALSPYLD
jgi:hypothetical protein